MSARRAVAVPITDPHRLLPGRCYFLPHGTVSYSDFTDGLKFFEERHHVRLRPLPDKEALGAMIAFCSRWGIEAQGDNASMRHAKKGKQGDLRMDGV